MKPICQIKTRLIMFACVWFLAGGLNLADNEKAFAGVYRLVHFDSCLFKMKKFELPYDAVVWMGTAYWGRAWNGAEMVVDERSDHMSQVDVVVNSPERPVVLFLSSASSINWNFRWTPGTKIAAVFISGHRVHKATGLPRDTQVLIKDDENIACEALGQVYRGDVIEKNLEFNFLSTFLAGRKPSKAFQANKWYLFMGEGRADQIPATLISADEELQQEALKLPPPIIKAKKPDAGWISEFDSYFRRRSLAEADGKDLAEALKKGHLKAVTDETIEVWLQRHLKKMGLRNLTDERMLLPEVSITYDGYEVISSDFKLSDVCSGKSNVDIFIPESVTSPQVLFPDNMDIRRCRLYFVGTGDYLRSAVMMKLWRSERYGLWLLTEKYDGLIEIIVVK